MRKLLLLLAAIVLLNGCATYDKAVIKTYETFVDDTLKEQPRKQAE